MQRIRFPWAWLGIWMAAATIVSGALAPAQKPQPLKTQNVILVMIDGMRWQEVFRGADPALLPIPGPEWVGKSEDMTAAAEAHYGQATADERRKALMPFLWSVVASQGQIFGNRDLGSDSHVTNGLDFSYPGYSETPRSVPAGRLCAVRGRQHQRTTQKAGFE